MDVSPLSEEETAHKGRRVVACMLCRMAHKKCDGGRPCARCVSTGRENECCDPPPKRPSNVTDVVVSIGSEVERDAGRKDGGSLMINAKTVDLFSGIGKAVMSSLREMPEIFSNEFGPEFMENFEENVNRLSVEQLQFLDDWHEDQVNFDLGSPQFAEDPAPVLIYRSAPVYNYIHAIMLSENMLPVLQINDAFTKTFGWTMEHIYVFGIQPQHFCHPDDLPYILQGVALTTTQSTPSRAPAYQTSIRTIRTDGVYMPCRVVSHVVRAIDNCPVYGIIRFYPIS